MLRGAKVCQGVITGMQKQHQAPRSLFLFRLFCFLCVFLHPISSSSSPPSSSSALSCFFLVNDGAAMFFVCKHCTKHWPGNAAVNPAVELSPIINSLFYNGRLLTAQAPPTTPLPKKGKKIHWADIKEAGALAERLPSAESQNYTFDPLFLNSSEAFGSSSRRRFARCWSDTCKRGRVASLVFRLTAAPPWWIGFIKAFFSARRRLFHLPSPPRRDRAASKVTPRSHSAFPPSNYTLSAWRCIPEASSVRSRDFHRLLASYYIILFFGGAKKELNMFS